jgi:hypothetical protein
MDGREDYSVTLLKTIRARAPVIRFLKPMPLTRCASAVLEGVRQ